MTKEQRKQIEEQSCSFRDRQMFEDGYSSEFAIGAQKGFIAGAEFGLSISRGKEMKDDLLKVVSLIKCHTEYLRWTTKQISHDRR